MILQSHWSLSYLGIGQRNLALITGLFLSTRSTWTGLCLVRSKYGVIVWSEEESTGMPSSPPLNFKAQVGYGAISSEFTAVWVLNTVQCCTTHCSRSSTHYPILRSHDPRNLTLFTRLVLARRHVWAGHETKVP